MTDTDAYITTTGERWEIDGEGDHWATGITKVDAPPGEVCVSDRQILAELRALRAQRDAALDELRAVRESRDDAAFRLVETRVQRDELLAALENAQGWLRTAAPVQAEQDITKAIAKVKGEA